MPGWSSPDRMKAVTWRRCQRWSKQHGLQDRVILHRNAARRDRIAALVDADLFCLPSYQENFGIAVAEAMAAGKPVVISDQVNLHAVVTANGLGSVVPLQVEPVAQACERGCPMKPRGGRPDGGHVILHTGLRLAAHRHPLGRARYAQLAKPTTVD